MKFKIICTALLFIASFVFAAPVCALEESFNAQLDAIDTSELEDALDDEVKDNLKDIGADISYEFASEPFDYNALLEKLTEIASVSASSPLKSCASILVMIVIFALLQGIKDSIGNSEMFETGSFVISVVACSLISFPIAQFISETGEMIAKGCGFASIIAPIIGAIGAASGSAFASSNYNAFILVMVELISLSVSKIAIPLLKILLALSGISAISNTLAFDRIIAAIEKNSKWVLTFVATLMVGVLNISSIAASGADIAAAKALRLVVSTTIPVIGGSIGDAMGTIRGSIGILRSTVGAFGMIATGFIFMPTLLKAFFWSIGLDVCASVADMFSLSQVSRVFKSFASIISIMLSVMVFVLVVFLVSTAIILK